MKRPCMKPLSIGLVLAAAIVAVPVAGKVYRALGPDRTPELNNGLYRWDNAYETSMTVNGRKSNVRLYSVRYTEPVLEQLRSRFEEMGARVSITRGTGGATGVAIWPDHEARFLVLSPGSEPRHMVFVFYPEPGAAPGDIHFPVPRYEGGVVESTVSNDRTGVFSATISTGDSSTQVHDYYAARMTAEGWRRLAPPTVADGKVSGMAVYEKGSRVCFVQAVDRPGQSGMITLLVKGGKL